MDSKKTAIVCISDTYLQRGLQLQAFYKKLGDEVLVITPDYSHRFKAPIQTKHPDVVYLPHHPYQKNLSWQRLYGHYDFAKSVRQYLEEWQPDRIHCLIPANSLAMQMDLYKQKHPEVHLCFDVIDMWPESLPVGDWFQKLPPAIVWKNLRNKHLASADCVFAECGLFAKQLKAQTGVQADILYWTLSDEATSDVPNLPSDHLALCYLGSVNNIVDLDWIEAFLKELCAFVPVKLHLIASGEKKEEMVMRLGQVCPIIDHGHVYDAQAKQAIFSQCHFGLNIMKDTVMVGLSMKSLDYLKGGLPIINSLDGDLHDWIEKAFCGLNIQRQDIPYTVQKLLHLKPSQHMHMRQNAKALYDAVFSRDAFEERLLETLQNYA